MHATHIDLENPEDPVTDLLSEGQTIVDQLHQRQLELNQLNRARQDVRDALESIRFSQIRVGLEGTNETQRLACLAGILDQDPDYQRYRDDDRALTEQIDIAMADCEALRRRAQLLVGALHAMGGRL